MRMILCTVAGREAYRDYLIERLPGLIVVSDSRQSARETFREALAVAGSDSAIYFQDDIILTKNFSEKAGTRIFEYGVKSVHQFFSMRKADKEIGTRRERGGTFMMAQCFYLPPTYSENLLSFSYVWPGLAIHKAAIDTMIADFLKARRDKYWIHVPSLVQHRACVSAIDPRRSRGRQSKTFAEPDE